MGAQKYGHILPARTGLACRPKTKRNSTISYNANAREGSEMGQRLSEQKSTAIAEPTLAGLAEQINAHHRECEAAMNAGLRHALEAGKLLTEAKRLCPHGTWQPWLEENFEGSIRTAQAYMRVAREYPKLDGKAQRVALLTLRGAVAAVANNSRTITTVPTTKQDAVLGAWEAHNCKNACQAVCRAEREAEARQAAESPRPATVSPPDPEPLDEETVARIEILKTEVLALPDFVEWQERIRALYEEREKINQQYCVVQDGIDKEEASLQAAVDRWAQERL